MPSVLITTVYRFKTFELSTLPSIQAQLEDLASDLALRGLVLISEEGLNATVSGPQDSINRWKATVGGLLGSEELNFKDSWGTKHPFEFYKVKLKSEIVALGKPELRPPGPFNAHLSPQDWHQALQDENTIVLDTRNDYEVEIGKFSGATDFALKEFNEFPEKLMQNPLPKDKTILMYCTGGIRCEKAILEMREQGYEKVFQLEGGILNYLKQYPNQAFKGECFVFDYRVAVDQKLEPTNTYRLCPHCGQPAHQPVACSNCGKTKLVCQHCISKGNRTCSKNCSHHAGFLKPSQS